MLDESLATHSGCAEPGMTGTIRATWRPREANGMIDKRPRLIARCDHVADDITKMTAAREAKLPLASRVGGHGGPGLWSVEDER